LKDIGVRVTNQQTSPSPFSSVYLSLIPWNAIPVTSLKVDFRVIVKDILKDPVEYEDHFLLIDVPLGVNHETLINMSVTLLMINTGELSVLSIRSDAVH